MARLSCNLPAVLFLLAAAAGLVAAEGPFTLEQIFSVPFPEELTASPSGRRVAWLSNDRGRRNIWVAEGPQFRARRLTSYTADEGQEIGDLAWSPDGRSIVYVRGGPRNAAGEIPNPTSDPKGAEQAVWVISVGGAKPAPRRLGAGHSPVVSPRGNRVAFVQGDDIFVAPLFGRPSTQAESIKPFFRARGRKSSPAWSPDGKLLAFVSTRGDHSFIGIYDGATVRYLAPSVDRDRAPRWSPDGRRLAFLRGAGGSPFGFEDRDLPWGIWVADVAGGQAREVWHSPPRPGGTFSRLFLNWAGNERLVFASEHDGWNHLYSIPASGGEALLLTPGECEVEDVARAKDGLTWFYSSNCGDIDRRHLWRVSGEGGSAVALTSGPGIEWSPQPLSDGETLVFFASGARQPAAPYRMSLKEGTKTAVAPELLPQDFPTQLVEPQPVILKAADGWEIHAQLFVPSGGSSAARRPAVVFVHGGPMRQMLLGWHYLYYYHNAYSFHQYLASRGYVVLSVNFRSGIGYGRAFRMAPKRGARGASEYQDVVAAAEYLRGRGDVDPARIGIWGGSYGGYLTAMALARNSDLFAAGVDLHGVHDFSSLRRGEAAIGGAADLARQSSPVGAIQSWRSPVLLIHGDDDRNVSFSQTVDLVAKLREQKVPFEQIVYPDEVHDFLRHAHWLEVYAAAERFFNRHLKNEGR